jgi:hypothetical protein
MKRTCTDVFFLGGMGRGRRAEFVRAGGRKGSLRDGERREGDTQQWRDGSYDRTYHIVIQQVGKMMRVKTYQIGTFRARGARLVHVES